MGQRIVAMKNLKAVRHYRFVHSHCECKIVRRILEQRVSPDIDFMEVDVRKEFRQPERLPVCNEVDLVTARRESNPKLGGDCA